jgi:protoporphyrinogen oxidase
MDFDLHIIGGGINGIISAIYAKSRNPRLNICIHEQSSKLGGNLIGHLYEEDDLYFDKGTHIFQETGNQLIDDIITNSIDEKHLIYFEKGKGDITGSIQQNKLNTHSHFIDIRQNKPLRNHVLNHITAKNIERNIDYNLNVSTTLNLLFGNDFKNRYENTFSRLYKHDVDKLSSICIIFPGLNRVVLDDLSKWKNKIEDSTYRKLVGVPNQLKLPKNLIHNKKSYYSKILGTKNFIEGLEKTLKYYRINVFKNSKIIDINGEEKIIVSSVKGKKTVFQYNRILISSGVLSANNILKYNKPINLDPSLKITYFHIKLKHKTLKDVFYFYNLESDINFYRVTNYRSFSGDINDKRITIEVINCENNSEKNVGKILSFLKKINFLKSKEYDKLFVEEDKYGFPCLSISNLKSIKKLNDFLVNHVTDDIMISGMGSGDFNFFQNQILKHSIDLLELSLPSK